MKRALQGRLAGADKKSVKTTVSCSGCRHYFVTWDPRFPYGCRALGFKSQKVPALTVFESSGVECQVFEKKPERRAGV